MTKESNKAEVNSFVQGLITEASPLNFPGNATVDEQNFVLNRDGTRNRRLGLDLEPNHTLVDIGATLSDIDTFLPKGYKWLNAGGDASASFLVVQFKTKLFLFDLMKSSITEDGPAHLIDLDGLGLPVDVQYSFASVDGKLVVATGSPSIVVISFDGALFNTKVKRILVRDLWGVEVTDIPNYETDDKYRGAYSALHEYNLYNQSWGIPRSNESDVLSDPTALYFNDLGVYPSNTEMVWAGLYFQASGTPYERVFTNMYTDVFGASSKAAKGYFIIDALDRGQSRVQAIADNKTRHPDLSFGTLTTVADKTEGGAKIIAEFAGRVFYAGFEGILTDGDARSPNLANHVFFSQLVKSVDDSVKCYQDGDPTAREDSDLVDTDGGFIRIAGADKIVSLVNRGSHLVVLATNGIWTVSGGSDYGFTATNYKVDKITSFGALSGSSVIDDGSSVVYWSEDGIYTLTQDQFTSLIATNITKETIQTFYENIPVASKKNAVGVFDMIGKTMRWLYWIGTPLDSNYEAYEVILDTTLGAFYKYRIYNTQTNIAFAIAPVSAVPFTNTIVSQQIEVESDPVTVLNDPVVMNTLGVGSNILSTRYMVIVVDSGIPKVTFAYYRNIEFKDWQSVDGTGADAFAYFTTGAITAGDSSAIKQVPYLVLHFRRTEEGVDADLVPLNQSGCLIRSQWDFANSINSNKWSPQFQGYRYRRPYLAIDSDDPYDNGFELVTTRNKIRGRGRAFAFNMQTEPEKNCHIVGWSISLNGNGIT